MSKNIWNYFYDIEFETQVYKGVYWVPINSLGKTRYTSAEMFEISKLSLENKRKKIGNLYEAIQLFQISEFRGCLDNKNFCESLLHIIISIK